MEDIIYRKALPEDKDAIWEILQQAIERRRKDGSQQWQSGYPNPEVVQSDIEKGIGFVLEFEGKVAAYAAVLLNDEPAYHDIDGAWLSDQDFLVIHRVAVSDLVAGKGFAKEIFSKIEDYAVQQGAFSIKVDTNFDNLAMLHILEKLGYTYCGEVFLAGAPRKAFQKILY